MYQEVKLICLYFKALYLYLKLKYKNIMMNGNKHTNNLNFKSFFN